MNMFGFDLFDLESSSFLEFVWIVWCVCWMINDVWWYEWEWWISTENERNDLIDEMIQQNDEYQQQNDENWMTKWIESQSQHVMKWYDELIRNVWKWNGWWMNVNDNI